jgi:hypothetical protein
MFVTVVAMSLVASGLLMAQNSALFGTWKLNVAKSKYVNAQEPKSETRTVEAQGDGAKYTYAGVAADGSQIAFTYTTNFDGKDSAISGAGAPNDADSIAVKRVDANSFTATLKKAGKVVQTSKVEISKDGTATTITGKGTNAQGQPTVTTAVFDKQ